MSLDAEFRAWGLAGIAVAVAVAFGVVFALGLSATVQGLIALVGFAVFCGLARASGGRLTYYHDVLAVALVAAAIAALAGAPVAAHLDATVLGLLALDVLGRIGCLRVGCCHGRIARRGVCYGERHVAAGFPRYLAGARLVPVQAFESLAAAAIVLAGAAWALDADRPGRAFAFCLAVYAVVRLGLEELRGDAARAHWHGLSEPQWMSLLVLAGLLAAEIAGVLPGGVVPFAAAAAIVELVVLALRRRRRRGALDPRHVREFAAIARRLLDQDETAGPIGVWLTSQDVRVSAGRVGALRHVCLSRAGPPLAADEARRLGDVVGLVAAVRPLEIVAGPVDAFHVLLPARTGRFGA